MIDRETWDHLPWEDGAETYLEREERLHGGEDNMQTIIDDRELDEIEHEEEDES